MIPLSIIGFILLLILFYLIRHTYVEKEIYVCDGKEYERYSEIPVHSYFTTKYQLVRCKIPRGLYILAIIFAFIPVVNFAAAFVATIVYITFIDDNIKITSKVVNKIKNKVEIISNWLGTEV